MIHLWLNPKAASTYSLEPSLKLVMKAGKPEHYLAGLITQNYYYKYSFTSVGSAETKSRGRRKSGEEWEEQK